MRDNVSVNGQGARQWWALGAVCLCVLAVSLDGTVLSVALPTLGSALHASESDLEWFQSGYLLALAAGVLPAGLVGDRFGRKKLLLISLAVFGVGSVLCAVAGSPGVFLVARLMMGLAGSGITVMAFSALIVLFNDRERPRAVGVYEATNFLALPLGPILGGWMLSQFWWGWVFLLNVPLVAIGLVIGVILIPESRAEDRPRIDWTGAALSVLGLVALIYGLVKAGEDGWGSWGALVLMAVGVVALLVFVGWERRLGARGGQPMIDSALIGSAAFTVPAALSGIAGLAMIGLLFTMPQYFQAVQGANALGSGLRLLPLVAGLVVGALPAGILVKRIGPKPTISIGFALIAAGSILGAATRVESGTIFVGVWMLIVCAGAGIALTAATAAALSQLSEERSGIGSAVVQAFQKTAGPFGTAIGGSVLAAVYQSHLVRLAGVPASAGATAKQSVFAGLAVAHQLGSTGLAALVKDAFVNGVDVSLLVSAGIAVVGIGVTVALLRNRAALASVPPVALADGPSKSAG